MPSPSWVVGLVVGRALPHAQGLFYTKALGLHGWAPPIRHACAGILGSSVGRNPTWLGPLVREKPGENCSEGGFSPTWGAGCWGMALPDVRHIIQGSLDHVSHIGARIPEAQVKVLIAGPAVSLVGRLIRGG